MTDNVLCSECFWDQGLRLEAALIGIEDNRCCPNCGSTSGRKLDERSVVKLSHRFFVWGTLHRCEYGAAPVVQFNQHQTTSISTSSWLEEDIRLIEKAIGVGFFYYGPRLWMVGEVEPLKALQGSDSRASIVNRILQEYPAMLLHEQQSFYRIRKAPGNPQDSREYDSPPPTRTGSGRLDAMDFPVMYGSPDLQVCVHECRTTSEDELYVATLSAARSLRLLDLTMLLNEEGITEFESLDMAVHMLFLAGGHSYEITRDIARAAHAAGYDGIVYPSYYSLLRTGSMPFETVSGISQRMLSPLHDYEKAKTVPNLALFGRPIEEAKVRVRCINRVILSRVEYSFHFGPVC
jgi:hypothetical protein